jgi:hypothetical protein
MGKKNPQIWWLLLTDEGNRLEAIEESRVIEVHYAR